MSARMFLNVLNELGIKIRSWASLSILSVFPKKLLIELDKLKI